LPALALFVSAVELGSVSRAAQRHRVAQPSASQRIRELERQLGVALLDRHPRGSRPTEAGHAVAEWAREVLAAAARLEDGAAALREGAGARLRVAASLTVAEQLLPSWLAQLERVREDAVVALDVANSERVCEAMRTGNADIGFIESPGAVEGLSSTKVAEDTLVVVVHPGHPWARLRRGITAAELAAARLVVREAGSGTRQFLDRALRRASLTQARPLAELGSTTAVVAAARQGMAPAVVSELAVVAEARAGLLVTVDVADLDLRRTLRAVWRGPSGRPPELAAALVAIARRSSAR
jgi:DNA-binding transcriptional LysR family regulator